jgi:ABC-type sugar transport system ATPase subunit
VDVGTKLEIHELIRRLAAEAHAVMVSSSDVPELDRVSDRCLILSAGQLVATLLGPSLTEDNILACAVTQAPVDA